MKKQNIEFYTTFDTPVPYKKLLIYPVTIKDYFQFDAFSQCFTFDKNSIPDVKIISMSDLEYVFFKTMESAEKTPYLVWFDRLLSLVLKDEMSFKDISQSILRYGYDKKGKPYFIIGEDFYTSNDFTNIKSIVAEQNLLELIDDNMSKEVRDSLEKARAYKNKISGNRPATIEDYIVSLATTTGWSYDYIQSMTIRKFVKSIRRLDNFINYKILFAASVSGMVEFKDKSVIKHWLSNIEETSESRYSDVIVDLDTLRNKVSTDAGKQASR